MTIRDQPPPRHATGPAIADLVIADIQERKRVGIERYGTPLQAGNGRDALVDAYQEDLDRIQYTRQAIEERRAERRALLALVERMTDADRAAGRPAPTAGYSKKNFDHARSVVRAARL